MPSPTPITQALRPHLKAMLQAEFISYRAWYSMESEYLSIKPPILELDSHVLDALGCPPESDEFSRDYFASRLFSLYANAGSAGLDRIPESQLDETIDWLHSEIILVVSQRR